MRALTIRQPWASLIVGGVKNVENRSWRTEYRGPLLIHAAARPAPEAEQALAARMAARVGCAIPDDLPMGGIIGQVELVDCVAACESPWWIGPIGWVLSDARPLPFSPCSGRLGLWAP